MLQHSALESALGAADDFGVSDKDVERAASLKAKERLRLVFGRGVAAQARFDAALRESRDQGLVELLHEVVGCWRETIANRRDKAIGQLPIMNDRAATRGSSNDRQV